MQHLSSYEKTVEQVQHKVGTLFSVSKKREEVVDSIGFLDMCNNLKVFGFALEKGIEGVDLAVKVLPWGEMFD